MFLLLTLLISDKISYFLRIRFSKKKKKKLDVAKLLLRTPILRHSLIRYKIFSVRSDFFFLQTEAHPGHIHANDAIEPCSNVIK